MKKLLVTSLLVGMVGCGSGAAWAQGQYVLGLKRVQGEEEARLAVLRDTKRNRVLWKRTVYGLPKVKWTPDRRALTLEADIELLVWREGHAVQSVGLPPDRDYLMGGVLSPDHRYLLVRAGMSGSVDLDAGTLYKVRLDGRKPMAFVPVWSMVREVRWRDNRTIVFRYFEPGESVPRKWATLRIR